MQYYTAFVILVWLSLIVLGVLVFENNRIKKEDKGVLFITYAVVAIAATAEWLGLMFNGNTNIPVWLLRAVKFFDYVLTPVAGGIIILQFKKTTKFIPWIIFGILAFNFIYQFISLFTNWMMIVDDAHIYHHGPIYTLYIVLYFAILVLVVLGFALYGRNFRRQNRVSLYSIMAFVIIGIALQIIFSVRIAYVAITFGLIALFIHTSEFSQLAADDKIQEQKILITIDPLTGILNRYAFEKDIAKIELDDDFVVFSIDINGLKNANDTHGHQAGDELICGAADVIGRVLDRFGKTYRTGGDEFIGLSYLSEEKIEKAVEELNKRADAWAGNRIENLSLSIGYASKKEFPDYSIDDLVGVADKRMYTNKANYYMSHGRDRRTH